jgi:hypothetical protein
MLQGYRNQTRPSRRPRDLRPQEPGRNPTWCAGLGDRCCRLRRGCGRVWEREAVEKWAKSTGRTILENG